MNVEVGDRSMHLLVADDLADDAVVLEYRSDAKDAKPLFALVAPEDPRLARSVITFEDLPVTRFRELVADAVRQPAVASLDSRVGGESRPPASPHSSAGPRAPGLEWRDAQDERVVTLWRTTNSPHPELWIRVWQEVEPGTVEAMVRTAELEFRNQRG
ncbi:MAG TPA: hypothetical protein VK935_22060 [Actinomycetospora sp.]|nr:hypothetical protein [Actinomycetospora sp.]